MSEFKEYGFEYQHEGSTWSIRIKATSEEDAWQRIHRLQDGNCLGVLQMTMPAKLGFLVKAGCFLGNLFRIGGRSLG